MEIRAGLHTGEVETRGEAIMGIAVHIGARVQASAEPHHVLKGVDGRWQLFAVDTDALAT